MKKVLFILFLICSSSSFSQNNKLIDDLTLELQKSTRQDSLKVIILLKLTAANYGVNPEKMLQYADESLQLSTKIDYKNGQAESYKLKGAAFFTKGNFNDAEVNFTKALTVFKEIKVTKSIILCLSNLGSMKMVQNKYPEAIQFYQKSIKVAEKAKDRKSAAFAFGNMGVIYNELKNYDLALKHFQEALDIHTKANYSDGIASNLTNIGNVYFHQKKYDLAMKYFKKGLNENIENKNLFSQAQSYGNIANVYSNQNDFENSYENHLKSFKINETLKNKKGIAVNYQGIGEYFLKQNKNNEALIYFKKANLLASEVGIKDIQKESFENLSTVFEQKGEKDSAYFYYKKYITIKENIDNDEKRKEISRLEIQYEFDTKEEKYKTQQILDIENLKQQQLLLALNNSKLRESNKERDLARLSYLKTQSELKTEQLVKNAQKKQLTIKEKEIQLKQKEIKINKISLEAKEKQKQYFILGLLLLAIIGCLLYYQSRNRKKTNEKLQLLNKNLDLKNNELDEANKAKTRFFSILNHDLRGPVANLIFFLQLQNESPEMLDEESIKRMQDKTMAGAENLLNSMEDILQWSKSQMENFKPQPKNISVSSLFKDIEIHFSSQENVQISFENLNNIQIITDENYLKTIIRNLTGNAIKALDKIENPTINWKAWQENGTSYLSISDNGNGASDEQFKALYDDKEVVGIKSGLGLHLIRDLAKAIDCEIELNSKIDEGTTFILRL